VLFLSLVSKLYYATFCKCWHALVWWPMQKIMDIRPQAPFKLRVASARDFGLFTRFASRRLQYLPAVVELKLEEYDFDPKVAIKYQELTSEADIASLLPSTLKFAHISSLPSKYNFDISHCTRLEQLYIESGEVPKVVIRFPDSLRMLAFSYSFGANDFAPDADFFPPGLTALHVGGFYQDPFLSLPPSLKKLTLGTNHFLTFCFRRAGE
jgi:hypothetical protein